MRMYKRIAIVVLGAILIALAFAAPALAAIGSGYVTWGDGWAKAEQGNVDSSSSPHGGYATNTVKCAVCHAVHNAATTGAQGETAEVLLNSSVAEACTYCHVDTDTGVKQVYSGVRANYVGADTPYGHNSFGSPEMGTKCTYCHQVHRASEAMTLNDDLSRKILSGPQVQEYPVSYDERYDFAPYNGQDYEDALTEWCTKCHRGDEYGYYSPYYNDKAHVMVDMDTVNGYQNDLTSAYGKDVAWASSKYCSSCHTKGYGTSDWPHYTTSKRFLIQAGDNSAPSSDINGATSTHIDGVCLRCHRSGDEGVGTTY